METKNLLSEENLKSIKETIRVELLKRGFTASIVKLEENVSKYNKRSIDLQTEEFQTTPVLFKRIVIHSFSSNVSIESKKNLNPVLAGDYIHVWISVNVSYINFDGGKNGSELFDIVFNVFGDKEHDVKLYNIR